MGTIFMVGLNRWVRGRTAEISIIVLALIGFFALTGLSGCSVSADKEPMPAATQGSAQKPQAKPAQSQSSQSQQVSETRGLSLQELSVREELGQTTLYVKFSQPVSEYRHFPLPQPSRIVLDILQGETGPARSEVFRVDTHWVGSLRLATSEGNVRLVTDIAAATVPPYTITPDSGGLRIVIGVPNQNATGKKDVTLVRAGVRADIRGGETAQALGQGGGRRTALEQVTGEDKKYTGQKISLEFKDADIKNVFRLLAEVSGKNIVVTDDVTRKITVRLIEVPWDQAMDLLVDTNGLGKEEVENVIRISTAGRLKAERDALAAAKKAEENLEPLQTAYLTVNYARVIKGKDEQDNTDKDLVDKVKNVLSPRGTIVADQRTNTLIVRDVKKGIEEAQSLLAKLDVRTPQVLIESNLLETTPTFSRSLGTEIDFAHAGSKILSVASSRFLAGTPFEGAPNTVAPPFPVPNEGFRFGIAHTNVNAFLTAAEKQGHVKIISRPSVVTLNNVESQIESANIIRVRTTAATVGEAGAIREIRAGIILTVTPQVSADGFVLLKIVVKSSTLDFGRTVDLIPQENTREAKANVLVRDGETVVIGGIMKDLSSTSDSGVPYLKDIPVLGWLFKKSSWQKDFEELVVFITPRILESGAENLPSADNLWRKQLRQTQGG